MSGYPISLSALSVSAGKSLPHGLTELRGTNFTDGTSSPASGTIRFLDFLNKSIGNAPTVYPAHLRASSPIDGDQLGSSISISGNYAIAGAQFADPYGRSGAGVAYIFERTSTSWVQRAILIPSDSTASDYFGDSVSISGDYAIIGASGADPNGISGAGAVYIFVRSGTTWSQQAKLVASDKAASDNFGISVAISSTGYAIVGADTADPNGVSSAGAAYIFARSGSSWSQETKLISPNIGSVGYFGRSVSIDGDRAVAGAPREYVNSVRGGGGHVFKRNANGTWSNLTG